MRPNRTFLAILLVASLTVGCAATSAGSAEAAGPAPAPSAAPAVSGADDALFTTEQARRGEAVYDRVCLECHTKVEFKERPFLFAWEGTSVGQLFSYISENMPDDGPGSLPAADYLSALAYILEMNGYPAGDLELSADLDRLGAVPFEGHGASQP